MNNFERVDKGVPFATSDGTPQTADEPFYPVLMSATGYESLFGYAADLTDRLAPRDTTGEREKMDSMVTIASR